MTIFNIETIPIVLNPRIEPATVLKSVHTSNKLPGDQQRHDHFLEKLLNIRWQDTASEVGCKAYAYSIKPCTDRMDWPCYKNT